MPNISGLTNANSYSGPMLPNPSQGIPGNPIHQQIQGMSQDQQGQGQARHPPPVGSTRRRRLRQVRQAGGQARQGSQSHCDCGHLTAA